MIERDAQVAQAKELDNLAVAMRAVDRPGSCSLTVYLRRIEAVEAGASALRVLASPQEEKDSNAALAAAPTIPDVAGCLPASDRLAAVEAANVTLNTENAQLRKALRVIRKGLTDDADGEFWPARRWLDRRDIFHGDLSGNRVLELVAKHALHGDTSCPEPAAVSRPSVSDGESQ